MGETNEEDWLLRRITDANPGPVPIVSINDDHTFSLDEVALSKLLLHDDIKDRYVVVVSIAGTFRQGKSFLLNFSLRYMEFQYIIKDGEGDWLGPDNIPLDGFSWRGGCERNTTGIHMWSKIFLTEMVTGEKVAIVFMDTQGAFDCDSTVKECATIFALSTMISSVQIYNLSQDIHEYDLQHLQYFTEYGRLALDDTEDTPFQKLQFLVRDWQFPYDNEYGLEGGKKLLHRRLKLTDFQHPDLQSLRLHIQSCFSEISCFLMPHPGLIVATSPTFKGKISDIDSTFKRNLRDFVPLILAPENLVLKKMNGQKVKAGDLVHYFKTYIKIFRGKILPEPKTVFVATAKANNLSAIEKATRVYTELMKKACGGDECLSIDKMEATHNKAMQEALNKFRNKKKMGGTLFSKKYEQRLKKNLQDTFEQYENANENKNLFRKVLEKVLCTGLNLGSLGSTGMICRYIFVGAFPVAAWFGALAMACSVTSYAVRKLCELKNRKLILKLVRQPNLIWEDHMKPIWEKIKRLMPSGPPSIQNSKPHKS